MKTVLAKMDGTSKLIFGFDPGLLSGKRRQGLFRRFGRIQWGRQGDVISLSASRAAGSFTDPLSDSWIVKRRGWNDSPANIAAAQQAAETAYLDEIKKPGGTREKAFDEYFKKYEANLGSTFTMGARIVRGGVYSLCFVDRSKGRQERTGSTHPDEFPDPKRGLVAG